MRAAFTAAVAIAVAGAGMAQAQNLVNNGSFETGDFSGWTQFGDTGATFVVPGNYDCCSPTDGSWQAEFGPVGGFGGITQAVGAAGSRYTVSFDLGNDSGYGAVVTFGGVELLSNPGNSGYVHYNFTLTALDSSGLSFSFFNPPAYYNLDNVAVERAGAAPEPASWAMMLGGFGLVGGAMRSRRKASVRFA